MLPTIARGSAASIGMRARAHGRRRLAARRGLGGDDARRPPCPPPRRRRARASPSCRAPCPRPPTCSWISATTASNVDAVLGRDRDRGADRHRRRHLEVPGARSNLRQLHPPAERKPAVTEVDEALAHRARSFVLQTRAPWVCSIACDSFARRSPTTISTGAPRRSSSTATSSASTRSGCRATSFERARASRAGCIATTSAPSRVRHRERPGERPRAARLEPLRASCRSTASSSARAASSSRRSRASCARWSSSSSRPCRSRRYLFSRWGQITGTPENCRRLLAAEEAVLVFPEGARGISQAVLAALPARRVRQGLHAARARDAARRSSRSR